jgi:hypothetical protein
MEIDETCNEQHPHLVELDKQKQIGIGWTNFSAIVMETKKEGFKKIGIPFIKFHKTL